MIGLHPFPEFFHIISQIGFIFTIFLRSGLTQIINLPLQNLAFQGGDVVAAKTSIVEKT